MPADDAITEVEQIRDILWPHFDGDTMDSELADQLNDLISAMADWVGLCARARWLEHEGRRPENIGRGSRRMAVSLVVREDVLASQAARVLAEIHVLEAELDSGPIVVEGSKGQPVPTRVLGELRAHRWLLARLLSDVPGPSGPPAADAVDELRREWESSGAV